MPRKVTFPLLATVAVMAALPALAQRDGAPGNPPSTATQRALDGALGNPPTPPDGTRGNPPSTATQRALDGGLGNPPTPPDGAPGNPPGTAAGRALDRVLGTDLSGSGRNASDGTPGNSGGAPRR